MAASKKKKMTAQQWINTRKRLSVEEFVKLHQSFATPEDAELGMSTVYNPTTGVETSGADIARRKKADVKA